MGSNNTISNNSISNRNSNSNDIINSRRSACDRCRGHKLRCVRPSADNPAALLACERCVKAGAECLHTVRTRRVSLRPDGYERRCSEGSLSPIVTYRRPVDTGEHTFRSPGSHSAVPLDVPISTQQHSDEGRIQFGERSRRQTVLSSASGDTLLQTMAFDSTASNATAMSGIFPMSMATDGDAGSAPSISFEFGGFDPGMLNFHPPLGQESQSEVSRTHLLGNTSGNMAGSIRSSAAVSNTAGANQHRNHATPQTPSSKDDCLHQLSQLSSRLLKCFSEIGDRPMALEDLLTYSTPARANAADGTTEAGSHAAKNIIGILLESSQAFLETIEDLKMFLPPNQEEPPPCSPSSSDYSYAESSDEADFLSSGSIAGTQTSLPALLMRNDDNDSTTVPFRGTKTYETSTNQPAASCRRPQGSFSAPVTFTIMTCYMWLLQGYEVVFAGIRDSLLLQKQQRQQHDEQRRRRQQRQRQVGQRDDQSHKRLRESLSARPSGAADEKRAGPLVLPNIHIGGFSLDGHPPLQIEMLIHVSCQMLQKIEALLGIDSAAEDATAMSHPLPLSLCHELRGLLDMKGAPTLLHVYLNGGASGGQDCPGLGRSAVVRGMVRTIRQLLSREGQT
ncbi:hypothetical protein ACHAQA_001381 [Verticillium albo-atrum]